MNIKDGVFMFFKDKSKVGWRVAFWIVEAT